jgi:hypothetical protein
MPIMIIGFRLSEMDTQYEYEYIEMGEKGFSVIGSLVILGKGSR